MLKVVYSGELSCWLVEWKYILEYEFVQDKIFLNILKYM